MPRPDYMKYNGRTWEPSYDTEAAPSSCTVDSIVLLPTPKLCCCGHTIATVVMLKDGKKLWQCPRCGGIGGDRKELLKFLRDQQNIDI